MAGILLIIGLNIGLQLRGSDINHFLIQIFIIRIDNTQDHGFPLNLRHVIRIKIINSDQLNLIRKQNLLKELKIIYNITTISKDKTAY